MLADMVSHSHKLVQVKTSYIASPTGVIWFEVFAYFAGEQIADPHILIVHFIGNLL